MIRGYVIPNMGADVVASGSTESDIYYYVGGGLICQLFESTTNEYTSPITVSFKCATK
jgi:hypothetical protein